MFEFTGSVGFGVDVGNFLELQRAFLSNGPVHAATDVEKIFGIFIFCGDGFDAVDVFRCEDLFCLLWQRFEGAEHGLHFCFIHTAGYIAKN